METTSTLAKSVNTDVATCRVKILKIIPIQRYRMSWGGKDKINSLFGRSMLDAPARGSLQRHGPAVLLQPTGRCLLRVRLQRLPGQQKSLQRPARVRAKVSQTAAISTNANATANRDPSATVVVQSQPGLLGTGRAGTLQRLGHRLLLRPEPRKVPGVRLRRLRRKREPVRDRGAVRETLRQLPGPRWDRVFEKTNWQVEWLVALSEVLNLNSRHLQPATRRGPLSRSLPEVLLRSINPHLRRVQVRRLRRKC